MKENVYLPQLLLFSDKIQMTYYYKWSAKWPGHLYNIWIIEIYIYIYIYIYIHTHTRLYTLSN